MSMVKSFLAKNMNQWRARPQARALTATTVGGTANAPGGIFGGGQTNGGWGSTPPSPGGWNQPAQLPPFNPSGANQPAINAQPAPASTPQGPGWVPNTPEGTAAAMSANVNAAGSYLDPYSALMQSYNNTGLANTNLDITQAAGYGMSDYGYTGQDTNGDGIPDSNFAVDPNNPYSKAAALQRAYDQRGQGLGNSMASQGQLYSGAYQRQQTDNEFQRGGAADANQQAFQRLMEELIRKRRDAALGTSQANTTIDYNALVAALQSRPT